MTTADVIGALKSFPYGGSISMVNLSLLPVRATSEQTVHLTSHVPPLGLERLWGLAVPFGTELRSQGSKPGTLLEQTIYMQYPQDFLRQDRTKTKGQNLSQNCMPSIQGSSLCQKHCLSAFSWAHFHRLLAYFFLFQEHYRVQILVLFLQGSLHLTYS